MKYSIEYIKTLLNGFPRVKPIPWKTPIVHLESLSRELGVDVYVKRDDMAGIGIGGNKLRKLEYIFGDIVSKGYDTVITVGPINSNHALLTAMVASKLGLNTVLILRHTSRRNPVKGNYLLEKIMGVDVRIYSVSKSKRLLPIAEEIARKLENEGKKPYIIPVGGAIPLGALGYANSVLEILEQGKELGIKID